MVFGRSKEDHRTGLKLAQLNSLMSSREESSTTGNTTSALEVNTTSSEVSQRKSPDSSSMLQQWLLAKSLQSHPVSCWDRQLTWSIWWHWESITSPSQSKMVPLKTATGETIRDKGKQMERWVQHYSELYSRANNIWQSLEPMECLPFMMELDEKLTMEELAIINHLAMQKASPRPGFYSAWGHQVCNMHHPQFIFVSPALSVLGGRASIPRAWKTASLSLYKRTWDTGVTACNNYQEISLMSIVGKVFNCLCSTEQASEASWQYVPRVSVGSDQGAPLLMWSSRYGSFRGSAENKANYCTLLS